MQRFAELGVDVAVIISDTFGRPWREGQTDIAIGVAGINPLRSYIGEVDPHGHEFRVQEICAVDELTAAAELVKGNTSRVPVAVIRGYEWTVDDDRHDGAGAPRCRTRPLPVTSCMVSTDRCHSAGEVLGDAVEVVAGQAERVDVDALVVAVEARAERGEVHLR